MTIEIWLDFYCPFCYLGKTYLEEALRAFPGGEEITIQYRSFLLDPELERGASIPLYVYGAEKFGFPVEEAPARFAPLMAQLKAAHLGANFHTAIISNTLDAHRLMHFAASKGLGDAMVKALCEAHFGEGLNIGLTDTLLDLAVKVGLSKEDTQEMLDSDAYLDVVQGDIKEATALGITSVPYFLFDRRGFMRGALPVEAFTEALQKVFSPEETVS